MGPETTERGSTEISIPTEIIQSVETSLLPIANEKYALVRSRTHELIRDLGAAQIVTDEESAKRATEAGRQSQQFQKQVLEAIRVWIVKPMNDKVTAINAQFRELSGPLSEATAKVAKALGDYTRERERKIQEARRIAEEETRKREQEAAELKAKGVPIATILDVLPAAPVAPSIPKGPIRAETGATFTPKKLWTAEVTDIALVPIEYHEINFAAVKKDREKRGGVCPGIRYFQVDSSSFGGAR